MAQLTLRETKGSPLTFQEIDDNFIEASAFRKNFLINGGFDFFQRGTSITGGNSYGPDMWYANNSGPVILLGQTRVLFSPGQTDVPGNPLQYCAVTVQPDTGFNFVNFQQRIEDCTILSNEQVTASFYCRVGSGTQNVLFQAYVYTGIGGSPGLKPGFSKPFTVDTTWKRYTATGIMPDLSGDTIGTGDYTIFIIQMSDNINETYHIANCQLEKGNVATEFERRHYATELALCERYYQTSYNIDKTPGTANTFDGAIAKTIDKYNSTYKFEQHVPFRTRMRSTPTVTIYSPDNGDGNSSYDYNFDVNRGTQAREIGETGFCPYNPNTSGGSNPFNVQLHYTADASL